VLQPSPIGATVLNAKCARLAVSMWHEPQAAMLGLWRTANAGLNVDALAEVTSEGSASIADHAQLSWVGTFQVPATWQVAQSEFCGPTTSSNTIGPLPSVRSVRRG
jgi:hypothetical protein